MDRSLAHRFNAVQHQLFDLPLTRLLHEIQK